MKFSSKPVEEHQEVPLADDGLWEEQLQYWTERETNRSASPGAHRSYLISVALKGDTISDSRRDELVSLVAAQGDVVVGYEKVRLNCPDPRSLLRSGTASAIADRARELGADALIVDAKLSPSQARNLEDATGMSVRDREAVILRVFQKHIRTRKARIQVEIAHLEYLRPRIRGLGLEMDQQAGGIVGMRGAGETASELLARQLDRRLVVLRKAVVGIEQSATETRKRRGNCMRISLLGYTNAGKTTLMNALCGSKFSAADNPFETLDSTCRSLSRYGGEVLLSDTVGFIRDLPEGLFDSFQTTLAEVAESNLLAIVVDLSDPGADMHVQTTEGMLLALGAESISRYYIFSKLDRCSAIPILGDFQRMSRGNPYTVLDCSDTNAIVSLRENLLRTVRVNQPRIQLFVPYEATSAMRLVYAKARVITASSEEGGMHFTMDIAERWLEAIRKLMGGASDGSS